MKKTCTKCKKAKTLDDFYIDRGKFTSQCKVCKKLSMKNYEKNNAEKIKKRKDKYYKNKRKTLLEQKKQYWKDNKDKIKASRLKRNYNITLDQYNTLKKNQKGCCKICKEQKKLVVDHCHKNGNVRGLLCSNCNTLLGFAKDNRFILSQATIYLAKFQLGVKINSEITGEIYDPNEKRSN